MSEPEVALRRCWHEIAGPHHDDTLEFLVLQHREPHRHYHTATHLMWVLRHVDDIVAALPSDHGVDIDAVRAAALFHDVIYEPRSADNEARSADVAVRHLRRAGWPAARCAIVDRLVRATARHEASSLDEAVLLDADLAVLGTEPNDYSAYAHGVRTEHGELSPEQWRLGRGAVLRGLLSRPHLFVNDAMRERYEHRARANLTAELAALEHDGSVDGALA
jgi:predicted metal-dependent HD superfamily phosphohydrolase